MAALRNALIQSRSEPATSPPQPGISPEQPVERRHSIAVDSHMTHANPQPLANLQGQTNARSTSTDAYRASPDSLIERLCAMKGRLNSNSDGQMRYFGPTSSLHLTESVKSISSYCHDAPDHDMNLEKGIPEALQRYLLNLYWTYQHLVLPVVHKQAFLDGLQMGEGPYFSQCLLLCILASGARISDRPQIRALAIPADGDEIDSDHNDEINGDRRRPLMRLAEEALQKELLTPSVTTIQSLMLLSVVDCCKSDDSKGWMRSGTCLALLSLGLSLDL